MDSFRVDFAMARGHELILERECPIKRDELDAMEMQMLRGNRIPFLLPVEWADMDGNVSFRYAIEGRRMLAHQLQLKPMGMNDFYVFLLAVAEALDECKSYLLRPECCLLREPYLFVGDKWEDVSLLYVPLIASADQERQPEGGAGGFASLVLRLAAHVHSLDGDGLQLVLKQLNDGQGVRSALKRTLLLLLGEGDQSEEARSPLTASPVILNDEPAARELSVHQPPIQPIPPLQQKWESPMAWGSSEQDAAGEGAEASVNAPELSRSRWLLIAVCFIVAALSWRYGYAANPSEGRLLMSAGATLCIVAGGWGVWRQKLRRVSSGTTTIFGTSSFEPHEQSVQEEPMYWPDSRMLENRSLFNQARSAPIHAGNPPVDMDVPVGSDAAAPRQKRNPQLASIVPDATVWMGKSEGKAEMSQQATPRWQLERSADGSKDTIHLSSKLQQQSAVFQIGRFAEKVDYADAHSGISRVHVELDGNVDGLMAKDMGSRNGTTLNGNPMIAYKTYKLQDGDALQLAGSGGPVYTVRQL
ncbi:FHA domain containing protein [Paenibacillus curdlanolyticus YK9]|uniref:FHA domain containing protein n=1 Tax=Paenibacillus curdlanolyticus YK9 TaxID=717606 RepID=E0I6T3_9BACL|nr:DUF6382 domain-containing protein [Paenibacillus curdlanolyticus]EFM11749.1 FHA domain containing protein [Paenibacillus curdlanolyticus YK9]